MDMFDFAGMLFGRAGNRPEATTVTATGAAASAGGEVGITLDADVTPAEDVGEDTDQTVIDLPTSPDVDEGDELIVTLVGDGPLKTPVVTANPGAGDRMRALANSAKTIANAAQAVAEAVNQHFFADTNGIHVTEATQEDWDESHTGANVLINSIGQLFRDGLNNLLALLPGASETHVESFSAEGAYDHWEFTLSSTPTRVLSVEASGDGYVSEYTTTGNVVSVYGSSLEGCVISITYRTGGTSLAIFDGLGNAASNVSATFSEGGATIGYADESHVEITQDWLRVMRGSSQRAKFGGFVRFGSDADPALDIRSGIMKFYPYNDRVALYFASDWNQLFYQATTGALGLMSANSVSLSGQSIGVYPKNGSNTFSTAPGTILWSGGWVMSANQTLTLTYNISTCPTGIVLHFQPYTSSTVRNYNHIYYFVPKTHVASYSGMGVVVQLGNPDFTNIATKYLYVSDDHITGYANNTATGTNSGITYNNGTWVMTQVIAV